jgi:hypothetical protein
MMIMSDNSVVEKIAEVEIAGEKYDLASNGRGRLVTNEKIDIYGKSIAEEVDLVEWIGISNVKSISRVQGLIDLLVQYARQLRQSRESRLGSKE